MNSSPTFRLLPHPLRPRLSGKAGKQPALGCVWFCLGSPTLVEIALGSEPDVFVIDAQHGLWERTALEYAIGMARMQVPVIIRCADHSAHAVSEALDAGACSVMVPLVETVEHAQAAASHGRYPPQGMRSAGGVRPLMAGGVDAMVEAARDVSMGVMIETGKGVEAVEAIAAVPGIDYLFIGTGDLALSRAGAADLAETLEHDCARVLAAARANGIACGIFTGSVQDAVRRRAEGFDMVVVMSDVELVRSGFAAVQKTWRD